MQTGKKLRSVDFNVCKWSFAWVPSSANLYNYAWRERYVFHKFYFLCSSSGWCTWGRFRPFFPLTWGSCARLIGKSKRLQKPNHVFFFDISQHERLETQSTHAVHRLAILKIHKPYLQDFSAIFVFFYAQITNFVHSRLRPSQGYHYLLTEVRREKGHSLVCLFSLL